MKFSPLVLAIVFVLGVVVAGCASGTITEKQQQDKFKALDAIAKKDPKYEFKRSHGASDGG